MCEVGGIKNERVCASERRAWGGWLRGRGAPSRCGMELGLEALSCPGSWASCLGGRSDRSKCILTDSRSSLLFTEQEPVAPREK